MSCYSLYAPGLGWVGAVSAPCSHDAAAGWYARRPNRGIAPASLRVLGPGGFVTIDRLDVVTPDLTELGDLVRRVEGADVVVLPHERWAGWCWVEWPKFHPKHPEGHRSPEMCRRLARDLARLLREAPPRRMAQYVRAGARDAGAAS